jgi:hypothetical protein
MILRHRQFDKDWADMCFIRARVNDSELPLHRLLFGKHTHTGNVNTPPTQAHSTTRQYAYTEYGSSYQFAGLVYRLSVAGWRWLNSGSEKGFTVDYYWTSALGDHIFSVQIAAAEQPH